MAIQQLSGLAVVLFVSVGTAAAVPSQETSRKIPTSNPSSQPTSRPTVRSARARITAAKTDIASLEAALDAFEVDNGRYPTAEEGLGALMAKPANAKAWQGPYLKRMVNDPWGHAYVYSIPGKHNPNGFDLSSAGPDGQVGTDDDIGNW